MKIKELTLALCCSGVWASGYHLGTQAISSQSTSNASTGEAADASTMFYNPAGLMQLEGTQITGVLSILSPQLKYSQAKASTAGGFPVQGDDHGKITHKATLVPHAYLSHRINDRWSAGFAVFIPYGSETEYDDSSVLRYDTQGTSLQAVTLQPTVAVKLNDAHSLGFGVMVQHTTAELRKHADLGTSFLKPVVSGLVAQSQGNLSVGDATPIAMSMLGTGSERLDAVVDLKGSDWGIGFNAGWMWKPTENWQMGVSYRSQVKHKLSGKAKWAMPDVSGMPLPPVVGQSLGALSQTAFPREEGASVTITTPESLSVHAMHQLTPRWKLFGDITWTRHSRLKELAIDFEHAKPPANEHKQVTPTKWKDTFKYALGASYQLSDPFELRFGLAYDESPSKDVRYRLTTLPDNDRTWFSVGGKYKFSKNFSLNAAYSYIDIKNATVDRRLTDGSGSYAHYKSYAQYLGLQLNYMF